MNEFDEKLSLKKYNTFAIDSTASVCVYANNEEEIKLFFEENGDIGNVFVLGGGSNIVLPQHIPVVLKINSKGINVIKEDADFVWIKVEAGEVWDDVVKFAVDNNYAGIEMLSAIPGTAGAGPVQNIGAYGGEIKDTLESLCAYDRKEKKIVELQNIDCKFTYRNSIFKSDEKGRYVITSIVLKLHKLNENNKKPSQNNSPKIPDYPGVKKYFENLKVENPSLGQIRSAIIEIRWSKLPKPNEVPNCGSFFENPIVDKNVALHLINQYKNMPYFNYEDKIKIPAGWLIENAGLKGADFGKVGTYHNNALVLINKGDATQSDVLDAVEKIITTVEKTFGIKLKSEPEIII